MKLSGYFNSSLYAEKPSKNTEDSFRLLVESVKDYAIFMLDATGRVSIWNAGAERIKGYTAKEVIGKHLSIFYTEKEIARGEPEDNLKHAAKEGNFQTEGLRVLKYGTLFWAICSLYRTIGGVW